MACRAGACGRFSAGRLRTPALGRGRVWWIRGPVPEGGWYGKGQGGGFLSMERPAAEPQAEREGVEGEERRVADTAGILLQEGRV